MKTEAALYMLPKSCDLQAAFDHYAVLWNWEKG